MMAMEFRLPLLRYSMVGASCAVLNLLMQILLVGPLGAHYVVANLVSFLILVPLSYFLHGKITFRSPSRLLGWSFIRYVAQWSGMLMANLLLLALLVDGLELNVILSVVLVTGALHVLGFFIARAYVFSDPCETSCSLSARRPDFGNGIQSRPKG